MMAIDKTTGDSIVHAMLSGAADDELAWRLFEECRNGYPIENTAVLAAQDDERIAGHVAWIISELGASSRNMLQVTYELLSHKSKRARFFAIDSVLTCSTQTDGTVLGKAISLLEDPEPAVRWKALDFLWRASAAQLEGAIVYFRTTAGMDRFLSGMQLLTDTKGHSEEAVIRMVSSSQPIERKFGAIAALRAAPSLGSALDIVIASPDQEIRQFVLGCRGAS